MYLFSKKTRIPIKYSVAGKHLHLLFGYFEWKQIIIFSALVFCSDSYQVLAEGGFLPTQSIPNMG